MVNKLFLLLFLGSILGIVVFFQNYTSASVDNREVKEMEKDAYWFVLYRKSNKEELYRGTAGDKNKSKLLKTFRVKTGIPRERPTPLPQLLGREYWIIIEKHEESENPETAPYFLTLDIPVSENEPYGPTPYLECNGPASTPVSTSQRRGGQRGEQCNWVRPGPFGLHGTGGNPAKLSEEDLGSSGCVRHGDEDITYLYNLLDPQKEEIRYYVEDR